MTHLRILQFKTNSKLDSELGSGVVYKTVAILFVLTNTHIVGEADKVKITYGENKSIKGDVVGKDKWSDIAVVKAKSMIKILILSILEIQIN